MTEVLRLIAAAAPERAALLVCALVVFALGYALRWALAENRAMRLELEDDHDLQRRLLERLIREKNHDGTTLRLVDDAVDGTAGRAHPAAVEPELGQAAASDHAERPAGNRLPLKPYRRPRVELVGIEVNLIPHFQMGLPAVLHSLGRRCT